MKALWFLVVLAATSVAEPAAAFHTADGFVRTANRGGGSNILYNGSPRFRGYDCTMCHQQSTGGMRVEVTSDPPDLITGGTYKPLEAYTITVDMIGAPVGLEGEGNDNLFVAEMVDDDHNAVGHFEEVDLSSLQRVSGDVNVEGAVFGANDRTTWTFVYHAPATKTGRIGFHLAAVAGDAGVSAPDSMAPTDPFGDDVFVMSLRACEEFESCDDTFEAPTQTESPVGHGCSVGRAPARNEYLWTVLALGAALVWRRRTDSAPATSAPAT